MIYTKILEVNLFAFAYRLFHEDFSPIDGALHVLPIEHSTTCDSTTNLNYTIHDISLVNLIWKINPKPPIDLFIQVLNIFHSEPFHTGSIHIIQFCDNGPL